MGSISLMCPMCCGETFNNSESLKYHLLSMTDNLYCPGCSLRTYSVASLIQHLDYCGKHTGHENICETLPSDIVTNSDRKDGPDILMEATANVLNESFLDAVNESEIMIVGEGRTIQVDENGEIRVVDKINSITEEELKNNEDCQTNETPEISGAEMLDNPDTVTEHATMENDMEECDDVPMNEDTFFNVKDEIALDQDLENEQDDGNTMYSCSTCGMSFTSVVDHIKEYHDGQEVVLEMAEQQIDEIRSSVETPSLPSLPCTAITNVVSLGNDETSPVKDSTQKNKQSMNTLRTEECIDSDGRVYTRKVVQIERFWDRTPVTLSATKAPMIEKFFSNVEGVKVRDKSVTVAPTKMYRCNQCLEQFAKLNDFKVHKCLKTEHRCDLCDQTFDTSRALSAHVRAHQKEEFTPKIFLCTLCGTQFLTHKSLRLHSRMHLPVKSRHVDAPEGSEEETFKCNECGKTLSESYRVAHLALHEGESITCVICNRKFDSEESLLMHAAVHNEINTTITPDSTDIREPLFVSTGTTRSSNNSALIPIIEPIKEESTDSVDLQKPYQCAHCGRRFARPHEKVKHERIHTGEKPHACEVCGKKFRVSYCLTLHMRTHTGVRPYECQHCGKRFKASSVYNHHLLTHGDERAYTCPYCPKTFKTRVQLAGHKNSHTKPFRCTECSRPFASLYAARAHMQTHKKDNNLKFSCNICGASYGRAFALKDHLKQHDGEGEAVPPEAAREEEVQVDFLLRDGEEQDPTTEMIVPSPPPCDPITVEIAEEQMV